MSATNLSLILLQLSIPECCNDLLQPPRLLVCRHIVRQVPGGVGLFPFAVSKHEGLVKASALHQVHCVLVLLLSLLAKACVQIQAGSASQLKQLYDTIDTCSKSSA